MSFEYLEGQGTLSPRETEVRRCRSCGGVLSRYNKRDRCRPCSEAEQAKRPRGFLTARLPLTTRETGVLRLMAEGLTNKQIGARLYLSPETVKNHAVQIMDKLGAANRAHAVSIGYQRHLLESEAAG